MQRNDGYSKFHPTGSKHQPFQTFVNNSTSNNLPPQKKTKGFCPKHCPPKKDLQPPRSFHSKASASSHLHLRIGIVGHVIFISLSLLMFALLVVWVIQQAMPRPGKKKMDFSRPEIFSVWRFGMNQKCYWWYFLGGMKINSWWFKVTFLGWLSDPFKGLSDLQLGDQKVTLNHLVTVHSLKLIEFAPKNGGFFK